MLYFTNHFKKIYIHDHYWPHRIHFYPNGETNDSATINAPTKADYDFQYGTRSAIYEHILRGTLLVSHLQMYGRQIGADANLQMIIFYPK